MLEVNISLESLFKELHFGIEIMFMAYRKPKL